MNGSGLGSIAFTISEQNELTAEHTMLSTLLCNGTTDSVQIFDRVKRDPAGTARAITAVAQQLAHYEALERSATVLDHVQYPDRIRFISASLKTLRMILEDLLRRKAPTTTTEFKALLDWLAVSQSRYTFDTLPRILDALEIHCARCLVEEPLRGCATRVLAQMTLRHAAPEETIHLKRLLGLASWVPVPPDEVWSEAAIADVDGLDESSKSRWIALLKHSGSGSGSHPSAKWIATSHKLLDAVGRDAFKAIVLRWFPLVDKPNLKNLDNQNGRHTLSISDSSMDTLRGLAWCCSLQQDKELARALCALGISAYKKIPGVGPRAIRVGNACVGALGNMPGLDAVGQLAYLRVRVKFGPAQKGIEKALNAAAARAEMPREDLEELSVSSYGLTEVGVCTEQLGDFRAELRVDGSDVELTWHRADGKCVVSVPAAVKTGHAEELKELKCAKTDLEKMLPAQKARLDDLFLQRKSWPLSVWRERYLDHPLVGTLARRLIWKFSSSNAQQGTPAFQSGFFHDGNLVSVHGNALQLSDGAKVELWHPLDERSETVQAWRHWLEDHQVRQPFKQAHREIYVLTDAEQRTRTYSNRFAAHIIKQHQFNALCGVRGWKNKLRLMVDDSYPPAQRLLPLWNMRVEFWIEGVGTDYGRDTNESGVFLHLSTDQVRFYAWESQPALQHASGGEYRISDLDPIPLERIPPLVLSEVLRDVDLFVGVCSVGNDPTWADNANEGRRLDRWDLWHGYSFGELGESAKTRKQVLERLVPRLKIAPRCSFDGKFLIVKGDLNTYKIHLGSGNILMEPDHRYLCIVPAQSAAVPGDEKVFLPFEGDNTLSVILSKAFMLANDTKIKNADIARAIKR